MNPERYPWNRLGPGAEPDLGPNFAARVIDRARVARRRARLRRQIAAGALCGGLALAFVIFAGMRRTAPVRRQIASEAPHAASIAPADAGATASQNRAGALEVSSDYGVASAYDVDLASYDQLAGVQNGAAAQAQDQGDVFSVFLPGADDVAGFASSYERASGYGTASDTGWGYDSGWD